MSETENLNLPFILSAQAQKHVTVNEALSKLDALAHLTLTDTSLVSPPSGAPDGTVYMVPSLATGAWQDNVGDLAIRLNGGWVFTTPKAGWRAFDAKSGQQVSFNGSDWASEGKVTTATTLETIEFDHLVSAGAANSTGELIPSHTVVFGIGARVTDAVTGTATSWRLGISGSDDRYGSGYGLNLNSYAKGLTGQPQTYYSDTPLLISGEGGDLASGAIRISIHCLSISPPDAV